MSSRPKLIQDGIKNKINRAEEKIVKFLQKIKSIDNELEYLKREVDSVSAILEYEARNEKRKNVLLDFLYCSEEYGAEEMTQYYIIDYFNKRHTTLNSRINRYELQKKRRSEAIKFIKEDIVLLNRIIKYRPRPIHLDNLMIDS